jgi:hypothetical protein
MPVEEILSELLTVATLDHQAGCDLEGTATHCGY